MAREVDPQELIDRFIDDLQTPIYPLLILHFVNSFPGSTKVEIKAGVDQLHKGIFSMEPSAHSQLVGRMEKTFGALIKSQASDEEPTYRLSEKGVYLYTSARNLISNLIGSVY